MEKNRYLPEIKGTMRTLEFKIISKYFEVTYLQKKVQHESSNQATIINFANHTKKLSFELLKEVKFKKTNKNVRWTNTKSQVYPE